MLLEKESTHALVGMYAYPSDAMDVPRDHGSVVEALMKAYEVAVVQAATAHGAHPQDFGEAMAALPREEFEALRAAYEKQIGATNERRD